MMGYTMYFKNKLSVTVLGAFADFLGLRNQRPQTLHVIVSWVKPLFSGKPQKILQFSMITIILCSCGAGSNDSTAIILPTVTPTAIVSPEPSASPTPAPTNSPEPTDSPEPTNSPQPTVTPQPTDFPVIFLSDSGRLICVAEEDLDLDCPVNTYPRQDGEFGRDADPDVVKLGGGSAGFDFTKLNDQGVPLSQQNIAWQNDGSQSQSSQWTCVEDNVTGLMWEIKSPDESHPQYAGNTYTWYFEDETINGSIAGAEDSGTCNQGGCDTQAYINMINTSGLCGFNDWRLPDVTELLSIANHGKINKALEEHFFPNTIGLRHWTINVSAQTPQVAWYVYFSDASVSFTAKNFGSYIRLVRGGSYEQ